MFKNQTVRLLIQLCLSFRKQMKYKFCVFFKQTCYNNQIRAMNPTQKRYAVMAFTILFAILIYILTILIYTANLIWNYSQWTKNASQQLSSSLNTAKYLMIFQIILACIIIYAMSGYHQFPRKYNNLKNLIIYPGFILYNILIFPIIHYNTIIFNDHSQELKRLSLQNSMHILKWSYNIYYFYSIFLSILSSLACCLVVCCSSNMGISLNNDGSYESNLELINQLNQINRINVQMIKYGVRNQGHQHEQENGNQQGNQNEQGNEINNQDVRGNGNKEKVIVQIQQRKL